MRASFALAPLAVVACAYAAPPAEVPVVVAPARDARAASPVAPAPAPPPPEAAPPPVSASATAAPPSAPPEEPHQRPRLACESLRNSPAPSARSFCELAMGKGSAASLVDARGYAYVAWYGRAGDEGPSMVKVRERRCGPDAVAAVESLLDEIADKLSWSGEDDPWFSCRGLVCDVRAEGEWSTPEQLYFRATPKGPVLEAWTQVEVAAIEPATATARLAWIARGRAELAGRGCGK
jgi:hypothetical protein